VAQAKERLLCKHEALSSNPGPTKKKKRKKKKKNPRKGWGGRKERSLGKVFHPLCLLPTSEPSFFLQ
jgi:hypothetical protein